MPKIWRRKLARVGEVKRIYNGRTGGIRALSKIMPSDQHGCCDSGKLREGAVYLTRCLGGKRYLMAYNPEIGALDDASRDQAMASVAFNRDIPEGDEEKNTAWESFRKLWGDG